MFNRLVQFLRKAKSTLHHLDLGLHRYKSPKLNLGQIQSSLNLQRGDINALADVEFQIFSQFGDDGKFTILIII